MAIPWDDPGSCRSHKHTNSAQAGRSYGQLRRRSSGDETLEASTKATQRVAEGKREEEQKIRETPRTAQHVPTSIFSPQFSVCFIILGVLRRFWRVRHHMHPTLLRRKDKEWEGEAEERRDGPGPDPYPPPQRQLSQNTPLQRIADVVVPETEMPLLFPRASSASLSAKLYHPEGEWKGKRGRTFKSASSMSNAMGAVGDSEDRAGVCAPSTSTSATVIEKAVIGFRRRRRRARRRDRPADAIRFVDALREREVAVQFPSMAVLERRGNKKRFGSAEAFGNDQLGERAESGSAEYQNAKKSNFQGEREQQQRLVQKT
ncbi:hypothetical protein C8R45DRAFT_942942 [Mycena sanguinolenta]|nr:hypothetical protein C8R45DRAFT_942942 [Mycena sanguinolenta]